MSSILLALEKLDIAVANLECSADHVRERVAQAEGRNIVDVDFVAKRLDGAISAVEGLLDEGDRQDKKELEHVAGHT